MDEEAEQTGRTVSKWWVTGKIVTQAYIMVSIKQHACALRHDGKSYSIPLVVKSLSLVPHFSRISIASMLETSDTLRFLKK